MVIVTTIKPGENLNAEIFFRQKIPGLWYEFKLINEILAGSVSFALLKAQQI